ncbi:MAG TPA: hypothetical protein VIF34_12410 [Methylocystis sp.]|jgi:4-diphosphocytidyl-2C-methyl-D-erythritol kinase
MKEHSLRTSRLWSETKSDFCLPTLSECKQLDRAMKNQLEAVEQKIQVAHDRLMADANQAGLDEGFVSGASATVFLSIAASMMEFASFRVGKALDDAAFVAAARIAADAALERPAKCGPPAPSLVEALDISAVGEKSP